MPKCRVNMLCVLIYHQNGSNHCGNRFLLSYIDLCNMVALCQAKIVGSLLVPSNSCHCAYYFISLKVIIELTAYGSIYVNLFYQIMYY